VDAQGPRRRRIDNQIELRRLLNGQIARLSTFYDTCGVSSDYLKGSGEARPVAH